MNLLIVGGQDTVPAEGHNYSMPHCSMVYGWDAELVYNYVRDLSFGGWEAYAWMQSEWLGNPAFYRGVWFMDDKDEALMVLISETES